MSKKINPKFNSTVENNINPIASVIGRLMDKGVGMMMRNKAEELASLD